MSSTPTLPGDDHAMARRHPYRFHLPLMHLGPVFGDDWFGRKAEMFARFFGTPLFLISQTVLVCGWVWLNVSGHTRFDPYPFILLNLVLSCLAAIQAPIIMMSQKRQEEKDRQRSFNDYRVNLKAELEIRHLHEKIDYLISRQWQRLSEIQQVQIEMLHEGGRRKKVKLPKAGDAGSSEEGATDADEGAADGD